MLRYLVNRATLVRLAIVVIVLFGFDRYYNLPREAAPEVNIPVVLVSTPYIGVSPGDIETLVTVPIENELSGVKDLKKLSSTSAEGVSIVTLEFEPDVVIEDALQKVRDRVNRARAKLPSDVEETDIREISFDDFPILIVTIAGPVGEQQLKHMGEKLADDIRRVDGVLEATVTGGREREITVAVDPIRLGHYGLSMNDVIGAIGNENVNIPGGDVAMGDARFLLRVPGEFTTGEALGDVAFKRVGDRPVFIRDVARIVDDLGDRSSYARMNGQPAVSVAVTKRGGANIVQVTDAVKALATEHAEDWPEGVTFRALGDQSKRIRNMVSELENGIITALILVMAVLMFSMGLRNSLFVAVAIPLSFLMAIITVWAVGFTLNMIVLFSLILSLGMLVDNAIVLVENIYRHLELGKSLREASIIGTEEIAGAVTASTATTVAAFAPLFFWSGIMGEFMGFMPKTVVIVLIASLVVAVGILPVLTAGLMKKGKVKVTEDGTRKRSWIIELYIAVLSFSIDHRYISALAGALTLVGTFVAYAELNHGTEFFPETEPNRATVTVRTPDGTDLETTDRVVQAIEVVLHGEKNIDVFVAETGISGGGSPMAGAQAAANQARITIDFLPDENEAHEGQTVRHEPPTQTIDRVRHAIEGIPGASIAIEKERMGPPVGADIAVEVSGDDFHAMGDLAATLRRELLQLDGVAELSDDYRVGRPEMRLRIDRGAAKRVGASTRAVAGAVRTAVAGTVASTIRDGEDEYDIVVRFADEYKSDLQAVLNLRIPGKLMTSPDTFPVPISSVASYEVGGGSGSIRHIDQKKVVTISGNVAEGVNPNEVRARVTKYLEEREAPEGVALRLGGANDEQKAAAAFLSRAFVIAVFLIGFILVAEFNRMDMAAIILASVVLSLIGVLWGLILTGTPFGVMMTGLGVISLAGVVVNNAIVLLDYVQQLLASGMGTRDALIEAGVTRFRPVMLTAITTMLGLVPMAVGVSYDFKELKWIVGSSSSSWWGPMAVAVIFGLAVATVLTLVMVPTFFSILEDLRAFRQRVLAMFGFGKAPEEGSQVAPSGDRAPEDGDEAGEAESAPSDDLGEAARAGVIPSEA